MGDIDLVEIGCGRRPSRRGGVRLELVHIGEIDLSKVSNSTRFLTLVCHLLAGAIPIVHNYGHSGFGWQSSWGFARKAVELVEHALSA